MDTNEKSPDGPLHPDVHIRLTGTDGNTMVIIWRVSAALRKAGIGPAPFTAEAMSGDYGNVLRTCIRWVKVS